MRLLGGGIEVRRAYSEYLYRGRYDKSIPCVERTARGNEGEIGYQRQGGIIAVHPHLLLHIHTLALALALLRDAPAAASNSLPDSRIAELPKSMPRRPCPLPNHSLGSRSLFDASIKTHRVLFVHLSEPDLEDAAARIVPEPWMSSFRGSEGTRLLMQTYLL
jgi:hypothetical protein